MKLGEIAFQDANIEQLLNVIDDLDQKAKAEVLSAIGQRLTEAKKAESIANINKLIQSKDPEIRKWISEAIPKSYTVGINFSDYEFNTIKMKPWVAKDAVRNIANNITASDEVKKAIRSINTDNVYNWGHLQKKIGNEVRFDKNIMGEVRYQIANEWKRYTTNPKITTNPNEIGSAFQKTKLTITPADIKIARDLSIHSETVNALMSDTYLDFANGMNGVAKSAERKINEAFKRQVRSKMIAREITGKSIDKVKRDIVKLLGDQGFTALKDRAGKSWSLRRYSEMLARTHVIKASNESLITRAGQFGVDIVEVSRHGGACPICVPYEGKIYSLSGNSKDYPPLPITLPIHPNCRHVLLQRPDL